jgi:hypothetical protein
MRFYNDSEKQLVVNWYGVPDDTPVMPFPHMFGSRIYERLDEVQEDLGERFKPAIWRGCHVPCGTWNGGLCGSEAQWQRGTSILAPLVSVIPGTNIPECCDTPTGIFCGGEAYGDGSEKCHMEETFDSYQPFGAASPSNENLPCVLVSDLEAGRGESPNNTVAWTHYMDVDSAVNILDGCTRTAALNTQNYADGDEVRIPTGGVARYVVVWVTLCDSDSGTVKRVYMMRHSA